MIGLFVFIFKKTKIVSKLQDAADKVKNEIDVYRQNSDDYSYVFYVMKI